MSRHRPPSSAASATTAPCPPLRQQKGDSPRAASKFLHSGVTGLSNALAPDYPAKGHEENLDIQSKRPVVDVPDIQLELLLPGQGVAPIHLRPARDSGAHLVPARLASANRSRYRISKGRGPTRLMSPWSTFQSSGSSSRLVDRKNLTKWRKAFRIPAADCRRYPVHRSSCGT